MGFGCGRVADRGGERVSEKRCGGPVYAIDMTVSPDRMGFWVGPDLMRQHQVAPDLTHNPLVQADRRG